MKYLTYAAFGVAFLVAPLTSFALTPNAPIQATVVATTTPERASTDYFIKIDTIKGESSEPKKGNAEPVTPDFGILLGRGSGEDDEARATGLARALEVLNENAKAADRAIESVSLNYEKITTRVRQDVKLFGFIPAVATAKVDIDAEGVVEVHYPWWAVFASGKDSDSLGKRIHDIIKSSVRDM